ncbi:MAG TPA: hypothetical protein VG742_23135 [Dongiaceae bacterium]|nr:hypothetical protein [Dongiaceae bacterium]
MTAIWQNNSTAMFIGGVDADQLGHLMMELLRERIVLGMDGRAMDQPRKREGQCTDSKRSGCR